jgi:uncharacterized membrane protein required for colicin V production
MVDALVLFLILIMVAVGFARGVGRELWALLILVVSSILTGLLYIPVANFLNRFIADDAACRLIGFIGIFLLSLAVLNVIVDAATGRDRRRRQEDPSAVSRGLGAMLGAVEGLLYLQVASAVILSFSVTLLDEMVKRSFLVRVTMQLPLILWLLPPEFRDVASFLK